MDLNNEAHGFALIDRLVTGEVDEGDRRELFRWLDREPARWRRCALALLESRELEEAFAGWRVSDAARSPQLQPHPMPARSRRGDLFALAASVLIAFALGTFARDFWSAPAPMIVAAPDKADQQPAAKAVENHPKVDRAKPPLDVVEQGNHHDEKVVATVSPNSDPIPPYVRSQWERHGYQVRAQQVKLPVVLPDGHRLMVPANEVQFNYVGQRTY